MHVDTVSKFPAVTDFSISEQVLSGHYIFCTASITKILPRIATNIVDYCCAKYGNFTT